MCNEYSLFKGGKTRFYTVERKKINSVKSLITLVLGYIAARYSEVNQLFAYEMVCFSFFFLRFQLSYKLTNCTQEISDHKTFHYSCRRGESV